MNSKSFCLFFLFVVFSCTPQLEQADPSTSVSIAQEKSNELPFGLSLDIEKNVADYSLVVDLKLKPGDYVISPFSKDGFYGQVDISLSESDQLSKGKSLLEIPKSTAEFDPIISQAVNFVRQSTIYKQELKLISSEDFEVPGKIWFLLEPICIPYQVDFLITHQSGVLTIKQTKAGIDRVSYKL